MEELIIAFVILFAWLITFIVISLPLIPESLELLEQRKREEKERSSVSWLQEESSI